MAEARRWPVISALGVVQILTWGSSFYLPAVLAGPVAEETGWPLAWVVGGLSLGLLVAAFASPHVGAAIHRRGGRPVLALAAPLLAVGLMLLPAVAARFWARELGATMAASVVIAVLASFAGLSLSYRFDLPTGPAIVLSAGTLYLVSMLAGPQGGLLRRLVRPRHLEA